MERTACCACGKVTATATGEPVRNSVCCCLDCQRRTGSAFGIQARFADSAMTFSGAPKLYDRRGDSGGLASFYFCGECGTTVYWRLDSIPGFVYVAVGCFADPDFPPPTIAVFENRRQSWLAFSDTLEKD